MDRPHGPEAMGVLSAPAPQPHRFNLGTHTWTVTTASDEAQAAFNQGLNWMYAFNHDEAIRNFEHAASLDPRCAMAWWGVAICHGPHINNPVMDEARSHAAWNALERARALLDICTPVEQALIDALATRYADPAMGNFPLSGPERSRFDAAYANAMREVRGRFVQHEEVATLTAEAIMDLRPWDLYSLDGEPRPETPEVIALLEFVLRTNPEHPGANHLYIHAVEASRSPERADNAATRLRNLVPDSGHMVHMPAHIDVRLGRWNLAADQNAIAERVHANYLKHAPPPGSYRPYMFHNTHFRAYACMMAGRKSEAIAAAREVLTSIPEEFYRSAGAIADGYTPIELEALIRFGEWERLLAMPEPRRELPITRAIWRFGRGVALAARGEVTLARREQRTFRATVDAVPANAMMVINRADTVLRIADHMLEGEILYREGDVNGAVASLKQAVAIEDTLAYMEPPDWVQPVRHALGAILLEAGRVEEAASVFREDLQRWPENGWALHGLASALAKLGQMDESRRVMERHAKAFERSEVKLAASCACVKPATKKAEAATSKLLTRGSDACSGDLDRGPANGVRGGVASSALSSVE
ncbi:MAG: tetratricopeptide repeat protein [Planctomycetota bacterium]|nr:tetratricopeptide repeat protein [Planctomycetota bacterium]